MGAEDPQLRKHPLLPLHPCLLRRRSRLPESPGLWAPIGTSEGIQVQFHNLQRRSYVFKDLRTIQNHMTCYWQPRPQALPIHLREGRGERKGPIWRSQQLIEAVWSSCGTGMRLSREILLQRDWGMNGKGGNSKQNSQKESRVGNCVSSHSHHMDTKMLWRWFHFMLNLP